MNITEMLITGYDGEDAVFAAALTPEMAKVVLASSHAEGDFVADVAWQQATDVFDDVRKALESVVSAPAAIPY